MFVYTVVSGDSLYKIAKKYNTTPDQIIKLNNLKSTKLSIGQKLKIPETYTKEEEMIMPTYVNYTVKKGDNLYTIAKKYNTTPELIIKDNALTNTTLNIGQNLKIRIEKDIIEIEECFGEDYIPKETSQNTTQDYKIKKGDTLYGIAKEYNTTPDQIIKINNLKSNNLSIGQTIKIPTSNKDTTTYTVKKGDTIYSIAKKYNTTIDKLKEKNNLKNNLLSIGQTIII